MAPLITLEPRDPEKAEMIESLDESDSYFRRAGEKPLGCGQEDSHW